jgi:cell volume regulation protein A
MRIRPQTKALLIWESVLTDVLVITIALSLMTLIQIGDFSLVGIGREIAVKFLIAGGIGLVAGIGWLFVLQRLRDQPLSYMLTVGALFAMAGFVEMAPIESSGAVAALMFGLAIGNKRDVKRWLTSTTLKPAPNGHIQEFHAEITFFVRTFFFVYLGLLIRFGTFELVDLVLGIVIIAVIIVTRWFSADGAFKLGILEREDSHAVFGMMARGLAAAVLATTPVAMLASSDVWDPGYETLIVNVVLVVIIGTTLVTTILSLLTEKEIEKILRAKMRKKIMEEGEDA